VLTIRGEKKNEREEKDYHLIERSYGSVTRTVQLPASVILDGIEAVMAKVVVTVTLPNPATARAKKERYLGPSLDVNRWRAAFYESSAPSTIADAAVHFETPFPDAATERIAPCIISSSRWSPSP